MVARMILGTLFRKRNIGPLSVSPVGLVFFLLAVGGVAAIWVNVDEAKAIQREVYGALEQGRPLAERSRLAAEKSGRPDPGVRVALKSPAVVEGKAIVLKIVTR